MDDHRRISIAVYSSISTSLNPDIFHIEITATARSLMAYYLQKHSLLHIDPQLITVRRIQSPDSSEVTMKSANGITDKLGLDDLVITPEQLLGDAFYDYHLSFEKGIQIKVTVYVDKSKKSSQLLLISTMSTTNIIIKLLRENMTITKQARLNLRHKTGILRGNENIANLVRNSKSDEFYIDLNRSLQYDKTVKNDILKKLKTEYERKKSDSTYDNLDRLKSNLSRTLFHENHPNHRKLTDVMGVLHAMESDNTLEKDYQVNTNQFIEDEFRYEIHRRSLPLIPFSTESTSISRNSNFKLSSNEKQEERPQSKKEYPPEAIIRTNLLDSDISYSSSISNASYSENNSIRDDVTFRDSTDVHKTYPNLFDVVKYCDLHSIHIPPSSNKVSSPYHIDFDEQLFYNVIKHLEKKPRGPNPVLGSENSAFKTIEPSSVALKCVVLLVTSHTIPGDDFDVCNISKGDMFVHIDEEYVLNKSKEYINHKLSVNSWHSVVIARLKSDSKNDKEKDDKIKKLKSELEILKRKYVDLHHVTVDNDKIIQRLTKVLKNQDISRNSDI